MPRARARKTPRSAGAREFRGVAPTLRAEFRAAPGRPVHPSDATRDLMVLDLADYLREVITRFTFECDDAGLASDVVDEMVRRALLQIAQPYTLQLLPQPEAGTA